MHKSVTIKEIPSQNIACVSIVGEQQIANAFNTLVQWAIPKNLLANKENKLFTIIHDSFRDTLPDKVRMSACLQLQVAIKGTNDVEITTHSPGKCIVSKNELALEQFTQGWQTLFEWMQQNGHRPSGEKPFEIYHNNFNEHPEKKSIVEFCIPIQ